MAKEPPLTFEEFSSSGVREARHEHFSTFFWNGSFPEYYRTTFPYVQLQRLAPDLEEKLRTAISQIHTIDYANLNPLNRDLYKAYRIMRRYANSDVDIMIPR